MKLEDLLVMNDMMRACFIYKRYMDDLIDSSHSSHPMRISLLRAHELQNATDVLRQALDVFEPKIQELLAQARRQAKTLNSVDNHKTIQHL